MLSERRNVNVLFCAWSNAPTNYVGRRNLHKNTHHTLRGLDKKGG